MLAFLKIGKEATVQAVVANAMRLTKWREYVNGDSFFLKVNLLSKEIVPGQCTSPWVFEGVLQEIRDEFPKAKILFGDSNVATSNQLNLAVKRWGFDKIGKRYSAEFINLSESEMVNSSFGNIFRSIQLPKILLFIDNIITIPVIKTHCITPFTGALKNQWGLLPQVRFKYHPVIHEAIAEINAFFKKKLKLGVADLTVAMEGPGPRVGKPKICNAVMVSNDLVALDTAVARYIGIDPAEVQFIRECESVGVGSSTYQLMGDIFSPEVFKLGKGKDYFIYRWRDRIETLPFLGQFILGNSLPFHFFGFFAMLYYRFYWYPRWGTQYAEAVCAHSLYKNEFEPLIKK